MKKEEIVMGLYAMRLQGKNRVAQERNNTVDRAVELINQLDEPELTQRQVDKWLDERDMVAVDTMMVHQTGMQNKVVVEKPVIPDFMAYWIEENECLSLIYIGFKLFTNRIKDEDVNDWISNNQEQFCRAFLAWPNVEVEKEKKYYIYDKSTKGYLGYNADKTRLSWYTSKFPNDVFTEQEIKAIDKRYWVFAEEVTE